MISILNLIVFSSFLISTIIIGIPTAFENVFAQQEEIEQSPLSLLPPTLDDHDSMIISEEICPPYCSPTPLIQKLPDY